MDCTIRAQDAAIVGGLPEAGSQGKHRQFSVTQAVRLAIHTQLVMSGMILDVAVKAMKYCDGIVKSFTKPQQQISYILDNPQYKWLVTIQESRYVNLD